MRTHGASGLITCWLTDTGKKEMLSHILINLPPVRVPLGDGDRWATGNFRLPCWPCDPVLHENRTRAGSAATCPHAHIIFILCRRDICWYRSFLGWDVYHDQINRVIDFVTGCFERRGLGSSKSVTMKCSLDPRLLKLDILMYIFDTLTGLEFKGCREQRAHLNSPVVLSNICREPKDVPVSIHNTSR